MNKEDTEALGTPQDAPKNQRPPFGYRRLLPDEKIDASDWIESPDNPLGDWSCSMTAKSFAPPIYRTLLPPPDFQLAPYDKKPKHGARVFDWMARVWCFATPKAHARSKEFVFASPVPPTGFEMIDEDDKSLARVVFALDPQGQPERQGDWSWLELKAEQEALPKVFYVAAKKPIVREYEGWGGF